MGRSGKTSVSEVQVEFGKGPSPTRTAREPGRASWGRGHASNQGEPLKDFQQGRLGKNLQFSTPPPRTPPRSGGTVGGSGALASTRKRDPWACRDSESGWEGERAQGRQHPLRGAEEQMKAPRQPQGTGRRGKEAASIQP